MFIVAYRRAGKWIEEAFVHADVRDSWARTYRSRGFEVQEWDE